MKVFPTLADAGRGCLESRDVRGLMRLVDENFDARASIYDISAKDRRMVEIGRSHGAATGFAGSGGAVVGLVDDAANLPDIETAYRREGFELVRPALRRARAEEPPA